MHLIVNLNLAMDKMIELSQLKPGSVHRARGSGIRPGGKGVNVARALTALGEESTLIGFLGGTVGEAIEQALIKEAINHIPIKIEGNSRTCYIIRETEPYAETVINEPGPSINADEFAMMETVFRDHVKTVDIVILTGSLPPGLPDDTYGRLIHIAKEGGKIVLLDTSSTALTRGLAAGPSVVKINQHEAGTATQLDITTTETALLACKNLVELGARDAIVTRGRHGAIARFDGAYYAAAAPEIVRPQSVGAGDAVLAGLAAGLRRGTSQVESFKLAIATGCAAAISGIEHLSSDIITNIKENLGVIELNSGDY